jgi:hypothetical protein
MKGITGGVLGPTGPTPLYPAPTASGARQLHAYNGVYLKVPTGGHVYIAGSSGGCSVAAGFPLGPSDPPLFLPFGNARQLHVLVPGGCAVRWMVS